MGSFGYISSILRQAQKEQLQAVSARMFIRTRHVERVNVLEQDLESFNEGRMRSLVLPFQM